MLPGQQMRAQQGRLAAYSQVANLETNPIQRIVMLYDGAIKFLRMAAADIEANDRVAKAEHTSRAMNIIVYLQGALDMEQGQEAARVLDNLYTHVAAMILKANLALDARLMRRAADLLAPVCEAWTIAAQSASSSPAASVGGHRAAPAAGVLTK